MPQTSRVSSGAPSRSERWRVCRKKERAPGVGGRKTDKITLRKIPLLSGEMLTADLVEQNIATMRLNARALEVSRTRSLEKALPKKKRGPMSVEEMALRNLVMIRKKHEVEIKHLQKQNRILGP